VDGLLFPEGHFLGTFVAKSNFSKYEMLFNVISLIFSLPVTHTQGAQSHVCVSVEFSA
jgi:hypothetical protein